MAAYKKLKAALNAAAPGVERLLADAATPASITRHAFLDALEARARTYVAEKAALAQLSIAQLQAALMAARHEINGLVAAVASFEAANGLAAKRADAEQLRIQLRDADIQLQGARAALGDAVRAALVADVDKTMDEVLATLPIADQVKDVAAMSQSKRVRRAQDSARG